MFHLEDIRTIYIETVWAPHILTHKLSILHRFTNTVLLRYVPSCPSPKTLTTKYRIFSVAVATWHGYSTCGLHAFKCFANLQGRVSFKDLLIFQSKKEKKTTLKKCKELDKKLLRRNNRASNFFLLVNCAENS